MTALGVAIPGCAGRMGRELVRAVSAAEDLRLSGAMEQQGSAVVGQDAGTVAGVRPLGVTITGDLQELLQGAGGVIDFSVPALAPKLAWSCSEAGLPLVVGTTGLDGDQLDALELAAQRTPVVYAPNMSVGVNVLFSLAAEASRLLGPGYETEVVELHHSRKADAPSGTAARLAQILAQASAALGPLEQRVRHGRQGHEGPRPAAEIGVHAVRGGDIVGEHTVYYCATGERLELTHRASSRQTFAQGALRALRWARGQQPGRIYDMQDVLGLRR
jgi:4-hydroxy-tetrahydrodipicolinate reductase